MQLLMKTFLATTVVAQLCIKLIRLKLLANIGRPIKDTLASSPHVCHWPNAAETKEKPENPLH
jgi:hypothetical protein